MNRLRVYKSTVINYTLAHHTIIFNITKKI